MESLMASDNKKRSVKLLIKEIRDKPAKIVEPSAWSDEWYQKQSAIRQAAEDAIPSNFEEVLSSLEPSQKIVVTKVKNARVKAQHYSQELRAKPKGLWYACGNDWLRWLESEMPHWIHDYIYELDIDMTRMLNINDNSALYQFNRKFGEKKRYFIKTISDDYIDWSAVSQQFSGIEICPYNWQARNSLDWYYSWDVN